MGRYATHPDAHRYVTPQGERLAAALGFPFEDVLATEAGLWLAAAHRDTPAVRAVRAELGAGAVPLELAAASAAMRARR